MINTCLERGRRDEILKGEKRKNQMNQQNCCIMRGKESLSPV